MSIIEDAPDDMLRAMLSHSQWHLGNLNAITDPSSSLWLEKESLSVHIKNIKKEMDRRVIAHD